MANDKVEKQLESLRALRGLGLTADVNAALKKALADRVNVVVAKAAQICGDLQAAPLLPELTKAFERFFDKDNDPQCWAKNALAKTLKDLDVRESALFLRGVRHVQYEAVWGGQEDTAAVLRGACAMALVQCNDISRDETLRHLVDALSETAATVRMDAAAALAQMDGREVALLLRLKARLGDKDPRVTGQVLEALLEIEGKAALPFVGEFLELPDEEAAEEAALALGASRMPEAVALLRETWEKWQDRRPGTALLRAMSASRLDHAIEFLIDLIKQGRQHDAEDALHALALNKGTEEMVSRVEQAVKDRDDTKLRAIFQQRFRLE
jgi:HEAT repeat protein